MQNAGSVRNNGYELGLTLTILDNKSKNSLGWTTTVNYSHNKNKVLDLGGVTQIFASSVNSDLKLLGSLIQVGQPLGVFYGYQADGLLRDSATRRRLHHGREAAQRNVVEAGGREARSTSPERKTRMASTSDLMA